MESTPFANRLNHSGKLDAVVENLCHAYGVGSPRSFSVVEIGYEDFNVVIQTAQGKFFAKMFNKARTVEDVNRYVATLEKVVEAGVNHPELFKTKTGETVYRENSIALVLMQFVEGRTFFELERVPDDKELQAVLEQAARVNAIDYKPRYLYDSWAIPNIKDMFERVQQYIQPEDLKLVQQTLTLYKNIPADELPHCFVHGDFTKANVLRAEDGTIYILDFSVANWYPRIQELAVIIANLLYDPDDARSLRERCTAAADGYSEYIPLTAEERNHLYAYTLAGIAMEFMGAHQERYINGNDTEETEYWFTLGREGLRKELHQL